MDAFVCPISVVSSSSRTVSHLTLAKKSVVSRRASSPDTVKVSRTSFTFGSPSLFFSGKTTFSREFISKAFEFQQFIVRSEAIKQTPSYSKTKAGLSFTELDLKSSAPTAFGEYLRRFTQHESLISWITDMAAMCQPDRIYVCDGSKEEYDRLCEQMVASGTFTRLSEEKRPGSFYARSDPLDVARVEQNTYICSKKKEDAGPTNNWKDPEEMKVQMTKLFSGCMRGRTMYVIPFSMGAIGSPMSAIGVELTDTPYVAVNMRIMTRMGSDALSALGNDGSFVPCLHSVGKPLAPGESDVAWPCDNDNKYIVHFPEEHLIWSYGSGYGGNALLGKKCFALRIASVMGREEGWLAEHMLILGVTNPQGEKKYVAAAFPSACGKTNLAMLDPKLPGWKFECVGDDIAWIKYGADGRLYAVNPEAGFFGVAPGTSYQSNKNAMHSIERNSIFTNTAITPDGDVWWEGIGHPAPEGTIDWKGKLFDPSSGEKAAHPNSRFTAPAAQCPVFDSEGWNSPKGVPLSAILFGGRRAKVVPLIHEASDWVHGVFMGSACCSEMTAAAAGVMGQLRHDPFAMLPFCGYNMGDYFKHWIEVGAHASKQSDLPKVFFVNWFRKNAKGEWLWPGFADNSRVMAWVFDRCNGVGKFQESPIGLLPTKDALDLTGLDISSENLDELLKVDPKEWIENLGELRQYFEIFGDKLPKELSAKLDEEENKLKQL
mmetsp:Transcript_43703/g.71029  ORF Transcript_43703/g.71029 Transcript_43703/m.71029 type:complete len:715 (-) Transcript_43703:710-2854(-)|eukprot:CAMPEP_0184656208 /NCGR_PEP_ID=MMETSP0308-20130426/15958_1 /TAXON_ID=38269 /ORGANISM="Gloeochaete witrockiana, Strain SAG 46.84" /LENGTH=714 /DNA_ID=CAMNT_0027093209 /DNA_START=148 /DNA_END=2292 /DNA_ORIENTATION=-